MGMTQYTNDLEDSSQLDADDVETFEFWANKQKDLVTSTVDYNLSTLAELISDETIDLNPTHQRRLRWNLTKQSKLIESFLMNVPIPPIHACPVDTQEHQIWWRFVGSLAHW